MATLSHRGGNDDWQTVYAWWRGERMMCNGLQNDTTLVSFFHCFGYWGFQKQIVFGTHGILITRGLNIFWKSCVIMMDLEVWLDDLFVDLSERLLPFFWMATLLFSAFLLFSCQGFLMYDGLAIYLAGHCFFSRHFILYGRISFLCLFHSLL